MPTVSIIVPIYKVEPYLRSCIESVLAQTFSCFELILVDDESPDNCPAICDDYAARDSRIRVIHKQNGGLSDARNAGLDAATGKYIYFLDGDDGIEPELLEKAVARMESGLDMVAFRFLNVYPDGRVTPGRPMKSGSFLLKTAQERLEFIYQEILTCKVGWEAWSRMFRRDLIEERGLRFADNRRIFAEDLFFTLCYCAHVVHVECMDMCLYRYSQRSDSIMGTQKKNNNIHRINELGKAVLAYYQKFEDCSVFVDNFPALHMQIVAGQFINQMWSSGMEPVDFQRLTVKTVEDWAFLEQQICGAFRMKDLARQMGSVSRMLELKWHCDFLLGGSWPVLRMRCKMLRIFRKLMDAE